MRKSPAGMRARFGEVVCTCLQDGQYSPVSDSHWRTQSHDTVAAMKLEMFALERMQSTFENEVAYNLSESGVHPLTLGELIDDPAAREALLAEPLRYTQTNGTLPLRALIASMYPGAGPDHIQVTNGGAEANYLVTWNLVEPGDEVVMMVPNFMQVAGLAQAFGAIVKEWPLVAGTPWKVDLDALERLVSPRTRLIAICNPNNPTGARFDGGDLDRIAAIADRHGRGIPSGEMYWGAQPAGRGTPPVWGPPPRAIVTHRPSKGHG